MSSEDAARVCVVPLEEGKRTDLPGGHWVCELISGALNGASETMLGFSTWQPGASTKQLVHEVDELCYIVEGEGKLSIGDDGGLVLRRPGSPDPRGRAPWGGQRFAGAHEHGLRLLESRVPAHARRRRGSERLTEAP